MAITTLSSGNDTTTVLDGRIDGTNWSTYNGNTFDAGAGVDTLVIDDFWTTNHFTITTVGDGIITLTSSSGKAFNFANYETVQFQNVNIDLGTAANDTITGSTKSDTFLFGLGGSDTIDGGAGSDKMFGGAGNDTYKVDATGDVVTENANEGTDTVQSMVTYTLGTNVENLLLAGTSALNGTGNAGANLLTGNGAVNTLSGGDGNDTVDGGLGADIMIGGIGNDTYIVNQAGETVTELAGQGADTVKSAVTYVLGANVENLTLTGAAAINATGNTLANTIIGNAAANIITGGAGRDTMTGGLGRDVFDFNLVTDTSKAVTTRDIVKDFVHLSDRIDLSTIDANLKLANNQAFSFLAAKGAAFTGIAGQLHYLASGTNTIVEGDTNGDKIADFQIELTNPKTLSVADFIL